MAIRTRTYIGERIPRERLEWAMDRVDALIFDTEDDCNVREDILSEDEVRALNILVQHADNSH